MLKSIRSQPFDGLEADEGLRPRLPLVLTPNQALLAFGGSVRAQCRKAMARGLFFSLCFKLLSSCRLLLVVW